MPERIPLDPPPGDPEAVDDLVRQVAGTVFCLGMLESSLCGPAGSVPGWVGRDATAAAVRVAAVTAVAREGSGALWAAAGRLAAHRDRMLEARDRIRALVAEQDEDYRVAWGRLAALPDVVTALRTASPAAVAVVEDFAAAEALRRREHVALVEEVVADATATGRVLAESSAVVGGTGRSGDAGRAVAYLAVALPEWGAIELAARGEQLARGLLGEATAEERDALAAGASSYAGDSAFARAFLTELGENGVELLLLTLGSGQYDQDTPIAAVLAAAFGAADPTGSAQDPVRDVLQASYVRTGDRYGSADVIAAGMAVVLAAGAVLPTRGPQAETVARWAGQLLRRENEQGLYAGAGAVPHQWDPALSDPAALAAGLLVEAGRPGPVAALLSETAVWQAMLSRAWADGGAALGDLISVVSQAVGASGDEAVRTGLAVIGAGLFEGEPSGWTVSRRTVATVAPALGEAVAAHIDVAVEALWVGVDDARRLGASDALRGLGHLTVDRTAADEVEAALNEWADRARATGAGPGPTRPAAAAVTSAYLATQEYGQRMSYALDTYEVQEAAEIRATAWDCTAGLVSALLPGYVGTAAGAVEGVLDGGGPSVFQPDRGLDFDSGMAIEQALAHVEPEPSADPQEVARQARELVAWAKDAFDRTLDALGHPQPVYAPESE